MASLPSLTAVMMKASAADLTEVKQRGTLRVGVYKDFPPFFNQGLGIDVDMAMALAKKLGVRADIQTYVASNNMEDDLRAIFSDGSTATDNKTRADVTFHAPIDRVFMIRNSKIAIFSPYYRENMSVIRNIDALPWLDSLMLVEGKKIGVEGDSIVEAALMMYDGGNLEKTIKHYVHIDDAIVTDLKSGTISAFFGLSSQVEPMLKAAGDGFKISGMPKMLGTPPAGWTQGLAVEVQNQALAQALKQAVIELEQDGTLDNIFQKHAVTRMKPL